MKTCIFVASLFVTNGIAVTSAAAAPPPVTISSLEARLAKFDQRAQAQRDERDIENLQRIYGYYMDRGQWDQVADLFAPDGSIEFAQRGVYVGKKRVRRFLDLLGPQGIREGHLDDRLQLQIIVNIAADGRTAKLRARELRMGGDVGGSNHLNEGTYENTLIKENGIWKLNTVHYYTNLNTDYDKGYGKSAVPAEAASVKLAPDRPPSEVYQSYPKSHIPKFHFVNPVTGKPIQYQGDYR